MSFVVISNCLLVADRRLSHTHNTALSDAIGRRGVLAVTVAAACLPYAAIAATSDLWWYYGAQIATAGMSRTGKCECRGPAFCVAPYLPTCDVSTFKPEVVSVSLWVEHIDRPGLHRRLVCRSPL